MPLEHVLLSFSPGVKCLKTSVSIYWVPLIFQMITVCHWLHHSSARALIVEGTFSSKNTRLPFPPPGNLSKPGIETSSPMSAGWAGRFFITAPPEKPKYLLIFTKMPFIPSTYLTGLLFHMRYYWSRPAPNFLLASEMQLLLDCTTLPEYWWKSQIQSL